MWLVIIGTLLALLKFLAVDPVAQWPWWQVLAPFGAAVLWWWYADASGLTAKQQMDRLDTRRDERRRRSMEALGMDPRAPRRGGAGSAPSGAAARREAERTEARQRNEDTITRSSTQFSSEFAPSVPPEAPQAEKQR